MASTHTALTIVAMRCMGACSKACNCGAVCEPGADAATTLACQGELARANYDAGYVGDAVKILRAAIASASEALSPDDPAARALRDLLAEITDDMTAR